MAGEKILIIDDDDDYVESTRIVLESKGYDVSSASTREAGAEKVDQLSPNLIIMDVMMEKMSDGFDFSRSIKNDEKYKDIPILMITAVGDEMGFRFSAEAGDKNWLPVDDYAEKPVAPDDLIAKVEQLLTGK